LPLARRIVSGPLNSDTAERADERSRIWRMGAQASSASRTRPAKFAALRRRIQARDPRLHVGDPIDWEMLLADLVSLGYERATRWCGRRVRGLGGIIDVFHRSRILPLRSNSSGTLLESVRSFALADQRRRVQKSIVISAMVPMRPHRPAAKRFLDFAPDALSSSRIRI